MQSDVCQGWVIRRKRSWYELARFALARIRDGIASLLQGEPDIEVVGEAADGQEAVELAYQLHPDVIIMDVSMPRLDSAEATRHIRQQLPRICIVGLSMHSDPAVAEATKEAGGRNLPEQG